MINKGIIAYVREAALHFDRGYYFLIGGWPISPASHVQHNANVYTDVSLLHSPLHTVGGPAPLLFGQGQSHKSQYNQTYGIYKRSFTSCSSC